MIAINSNYGVRNNRITTVLSGDGLTTCHIYIHTYIPLVLYPEGVAEASQIFLRDTHVFSKLLIGTLQT
jgi:hypothetical protein